MSSAGAPRRGNAGCSNRSRPLVSDSRTTETIPARLVRLALPVVGLNLLGVVGLFIDTAMCSRLPEKPVALAALGFAGQLVFLANVLMMGLTVGTVALVARAHGAGDRARVGHIVAQSTNLTVLAALGVATLGNLAVPSLLRGLGATPDVAALAAAYLRPVFAGSVFYFLLVLYAAVLRGVGSTMLPFLVGLGWNALNVVFNYALIYGHFGAPRLGVVGAGVSTILAQGVGIALLLVMLARGVVPELELALRPRALDGALVRELLRLGAPATLDALILNVAFLSLIYLLGFVDGEAIAAHGVGLRVQNVAFVPALGLSQVSAAMVGNALGAARRGDARAITRATVMLSSGVMTLLGVLLLVFAPGIAEGAFAIEPGTALHRYALTWIRVLGMGMPIVGMHLALLGTLRGAGATGTSLRINLVGTCFVQLPLSVFLGFSVGLGPLGIWLSLPLSYLAKLALAVLAYRREEWARVGTAA